MATSPWANCYYKKTLDGGNYYEEKFYDKKAHGQKICIFLIKINML